MTPRIDDDGAGTLTVGGARFLLIRPETLAALQRAVEEALGRRAADCLAAGGRAGRARATAGLSGTGEEKARRLVEMGRAIGWGHFALEQFDGDGFVVVVHGSPFAMSYRPVAWSQPVAPEILPRTSASAWPISGRTESDSCA